VLYACDRVGEMISGDSEMAEKVNGIISGGSRRTRSVDAQRTARALWALLALFVARVTGQALVAFAGVPWLPAMAEWYSGILPYPILFPLQIALVVLLGRVCVEFGRGEGFFVRPNRAFAAPLWWLGWLYAGSMVVRYAATMIVRPEARWHHGTIPIVFHIVLATFVILVARHHRRALAASPVGR
jgi:hypothetical protein